MKLTHEMIRQFAIRKGGYNKKQIKLLGLSWPPRTGWKDKIVGKNYPDEVIQMLYDESKVATKKLNERRPLNQTKKPKLISYSEIKKRFTDERRKLSYKDQLDHGNWRILRRYIIQRDHKTCQSCHEQKVKSLHVHHLKYVGNYAWDTPPEYLITLCSKCHKAAHEAEEKKQNNITSPKHQASANKTKRSKQPRSVKKKKANREFNGDEISYLIDRLVKSTSLSPLGMKKEINNIIERLKSRLRELDLIDYEIDLAAMKESNIHHPNKE